MKTYTIPEFGITVQVVPGGSRNSASIESDLRKHLFGDPDPAMSDIYSDAEEEAVVDALESLILAHACAGLDISSPAYVDGLRTSLEAIANHS